MMAAYGLEEFSNDLISFLQTNLNSKLTEINQIYQDSIGLLSIDNDAYFFQSLDDRITNFNPFVFIQAEVPNVPDSAPSGFVATYRFMVLICFSSDNADSETGKKSARYNRALIELFTQKFQEVNRRIKLRIPGLEPAGFAQINSTQVVRSSGIYLELPLGY